MEQHVPELSLFRTEVLESRQSRWLGTVLLVPKISHHIFTLVSLFSIVLVLSLLFFASYTRTQKVNGWLVPDRGVVRVLAPQDGIISALRVNDGDRVEVNDSLLTLSSNIRSASLGDTQAEVVERIRNRLNSFTLELQLLDQEMLVKTSTLKQKISALWTEINNFDEEISVQEAQVSLSSSSANRLREAGLGGLVSRQTIENAEATYLQQYKSLRSMQSKKSTIRSQIVSLKSEQALLPVQMKRRKAEIIRQIAALEQELAMAEARREIEVTASTAGTVTTLGVEEGSSVNSSTTLLSITPTDATLQAQLFVPTEAVGFLHEGQQVLLRYRAFPYQKFGHYYGAIRSISSASVNPNEVSAGMAGMTELLPNNAPVYFVTVRLDDQFVTTYGERKPLQVGMQLEANVQIERRRLFEWALDPLYTIVGKDSA